MKIVAMTNQEMTDFAYPDYELIIPTYQNDGNWTIFQGFVYFNPEDIIDYNMEYNYVVALTDSNEIVGVIQYGLYRNKYHGVTFIDVKEGYKRQGISKQLIKCLDETIPKEYPLYISEMRKEGKEANIKEVFNKIITSVKIVEGQGYW